MANATKSGKGELRVDFDEPVPPSDVDVLWSLPYNARVSSVVVRYVQIPHDVARAELQARVAAAKRHDAAVKANATRKARKGGAE